MVSDGLDYQADGEGMRGPVRRHLHVLDLDGGGIRQITDGPESAGALAWSPDGTVLAFTRRAGADSDLRHRAPVHLLEVDAPHARPRVLAFADGVAATVGWVADGSALLVVGWSGDPAGHARLYRVDAARRRGRRPVGGARPQRDARRSRLSRRSATGTRGPGRVLPARPRLHPPVVGHDRGR
ncbi:TolB family protein [Actinomadura madurae]|uniref:TolB family protein n=1 Tax=Actinomadura madurae TaxID=1993 RepID=UPI0020D218FA|nr:hypothetical protein [Actinomadura madurae]MCQ0010537.1 hypothetical protein [Actinomadura madurae]